MINGLGFYYLIVRFTNIEDGTYFYNHISRKWEDFSWNCILHYKGTADAVLSIVTQDQKDAYLLVRKKSIKATLEEVEKDVPSIRRWIDRQAGKSP